LDMKVAKHFITAPPTDQADNNICINVDIKQGRGTGRRLEGKRVETSAAWWKPRVGPRNVNLYCHWRLDVGRVAPDPRTSAQHSVRHLQPVVRDRTGLLLVGAMVLPVRYCWAKTCWRRAAGSWRLENRASRVGEIVEMRGVIAHAVFESGNEVMAGMGCSNDGVDGGGLVS
jgi:hypothetical protein